MRIEQLMTRPPRICLADSSLDQAAATMWQGDCGCLPVTAADGSERLVGMITDRDICMAACFTGRRLDEIQVAEVMTATVWACNPQDDLEEAQTIMQETLVRRLPVIDASDRVIGVISLADLAREAARKPGSLNRAISTGSVGSLLASICDPHQVAVLAPAAPPARPPDSSAERQLQAC